MLTHRWWGNKFCKRTCKDAYLRELALGRDKICRWYGFLRGERFQTSLPVRPNNPVQTSATKLSSRSAKAAPRESTVRHQAALSTASTPRELRLRKPL
jgi:hypothetical protein